MSKANLTYTPLIADHPSYKDTWHICWLNNDNQPVIGLLPRVSWTVRTGCTNSADDRHLKYHTVPHVTKHATPPKIQTNIKTDSQDTAILIHVLKTTRSSDYKKTTVNRCTDLSINPLLQDILTTYDDWIDELIEYCNQQATSALDKPINSPLNKQPNKNLDDEYFEDNHLDNKYLKNEAPLVPNLIDHKLLNINSYDSGLMGFIGYDIGAKALSPLSSIPLAEQPCAFLGHYDIYLTHTRQGWQLQAQADTHKDTVASVYALLQRLDAKLSASVGSESMKSFIASLPTPSVTLKSNWKMTKYREAFEQTQEYLYKGDSYQINLTQKWQGHLNKSLITNKQTDNDNYAMLVNYLPKLYANTKAPFAGYLGLIDNYHTPHTSQNVSKEATNLDGSSTKFELLSCSPELFVVFNKNKEGSHQITTKPIKGTRPRSLEPTEDATLKIALKNSDKDRAENVMIVDLLRNDLGKYAKTGSVQVPKLFAIESFSNVHHMVSTVTATLKEDIHPLTMLFDSLPAGSITGTPKKRAVEIISELEAEARGAYCGTMGYMNFDGTGQWNVLIRTLQAQNDNVSLWAGGGITVGSNCKAEYQECLDKVGNLLAVLSSK